MNCTLCDTILDKVIDEHYFICHTCGAYVKHKKHYIASIKEKERYELHNNDVHDTRYQIFTSPITNAILKNQIKEQIGLDFGCGTGPVISKQLTEKGYLVVLYDPYFYPNPEYLNNHYDYIFSCEVFEHFHNPKREIEKLVWLLKPKGRLYIMTHLHQPDIDFRNWYYRKDPTHVFIYSRQTIEYIAAKYSLVVEEITERMIVVRKL